MEGTVRQVAEEHGVEFALTWADHRTECLESEVRRLRQALRNVSNAAVVSDTQIARTLAQAALSMLDGR